MKQLWIGLIVAGSLAACKGSNNARDTTGMGSQGTAGGSLPATRPDTTGMSSGATVTPPAPITYDTTKRDTTKHDTTKSDTTKHHKKSHKRP